MALSGAQAPGTPPEAVFGGLSVVPAINGAGHVAFESHLQTGSGGVEFDNRQGIWLADQQGDALLVARAGDSLVGKTIDRLFLFTGSGGQDGRKTSLNDYGQVTYSVNFTDGTAGAFLFTPDLHWRSSADGNWDDHDNWTLTSEPAAAHRVMIDAEVDVTVSGPSGDTSVKALSIGGGAGAAEIVLQPGANLTAADGVSIQPGGILSGDGNLIGSVFSSGLLSPGESSGTIHFLGDYTQDPLGILEIELGGTGPGEFGVLEVNGIAAFVGTLNVTLADGFTPGPGDTFEILTFGDRQADFIAYGGLDIGVDIRFEPIWSDTTLRLTVVPERSTLVLAAVGLLCLLAGTESPLDCWTVD